MARPKKPSWDADAQPEVRAGCALVIVRAFLFRDPDTNRHYTQVELYERCEAVEDRQAQDNPKLRRRFKDVGEDQAKRRIIALEKGSRKKDLEYDFTVVAHVFGLDGNFFFLQFRDADDLEEAFRRARVVTVPPLEGAGPDGPIYSHGFRAVPTSDVIAEPRRRLASGIASQIEFIEPVRVNVLLLQGPTGTGKTYFVSHWLRDYADRLGINLALRIDCSNLSLDQLLPVVTDILSGLRSRGGGGGRSTHSRNALILIVIDGLRLEGGQATSVIAGGQRSRVSAVISTLSSIIEQPGRLIVVVCLEANDRRLKASDVESALPPDTVVRSHEIGGLSANEGAEFLWDIHVRDIPKRTRRGLSVRLNGLPIALYAAARTINELDPVDRDQFIEELPIDEADQFAVFFRKFLDRLPLGTDASPNNVHPHAVLRLLALMPGPVPPEFLLEFARNGTVKRLAGVSIDRLKNAQYPFTHKVDANLDVHAMVRSFLRDEIAGFVRDNRFDAFTSLWELKWIHWQAARLHWYTLTERKDINAYAVNSIDAFVHHVIELIRLIRISTPREAGRLRWGIGPKIVERFVDKLESSSPRQLWQIAYNHAVRPYLLDKRYAATRVYGQYIAKARVIGAMSAAIDEDIPIPDFERIELDKEAALCWMHGGRLKLAEAHLQKALSRISLRDAVNVGGVGTVDRPSSAANRWRVACDLVSLRTLVDMRSGRHLQLILDGLARFWSTADRIVDQVLQGTEPYSEKHGPDLEKGALRVLVRVADVLLHMGSVEQALECFERAERLQQRIRGRHLDGEAARRYVLALVRSKHSRADALDLAERLLEGNISFYRHAVAGSPLGASSDLVPFLLMRGALARIRGDLSTAAGHVEEVLRLDLVQRGECTYVVEKEIEVERLRLALQQFGAGPTLLQQAEQLRRDLEATHHFLPALDAALIEAECVGEAFRCGLAERYLKQAVVFGAGLRTADFKNLSDRGAGVASYGL